MSHHQGWFRVLSHQSARPPPGTAGQPTHPHTQTHAHTSTHTWPQVAESLHAHPLSAFPLINASDRRAADGSNLCVKSSPARRGGKQFQALSSDTCDGTRRSQMRATSGGGTFCVSAASNESERGQQLLQEALLSPRLALPHLCLTHCAYVLHVGLCCVSQRVMEQRHLNKNGDGRLNVKQKRNNAANTQRERWRSGNTSEKSQRFKRMRS